VQRVVQVVLETRMTKCSTSKMDQYHNVERRDPLKKCQVINGRIIYIEQWRRSSRLMHKDNIKEGEEILSSPKRISSHRPTNVTKNQSLRKMLCITISQSIHYKTLYSWNIKNISKFYNVNKDFIKNNTLISITS